MTFRTPVRSLLALAVALALTACDDPKTADERAKALEGGNPLPEAAGEVTFPWIGKQSIACIGEAVERIVAAVSFADKEHANVPLGTVKLDGKGGGSGELKLQASYLTTADEGRDEHLHGPMWIDAKEHPDVVLKIATLQRVKPTVWRATGTLSLNGVETKADFLANVRWIGKMDYVADDGVIRVAATLPVDLKAHKIGGEWAGTPAVAAEWQLSVVLLGVLKKS